MTEKQKKAMKEAGVDYTYNSVYELTYTAVKKDVEVMKIFERR